MIARAVVGNRDFARDMGSSGTPDKRAYPAFAKMSQQHSTPWRDDPGADACMGWAEEFTDAFGRYRGLSLEGRAAMMGGLEAGLRMGMALTLIDADWARRVYTALDREVSAAGGLPAEADAETSRRLRTWQRAQAIIDSSSSGP